MLQVYSLSIYLANVVPQAVYVTSNVATESEADVFFDLVIVEHRQGLRVQETHYDPYGVEPYTKSKARKLGREVKL